MDATDILLSNSVDAHGLIDARGAFSEPEMQLYLSGANLFV